MSFIVTDRYPVHNASGVYINDVIWAQFNQYVDEDTATYYNFTVNKRSDYSPVEGAISVQSVSGHVDDSVIVFVPTNGLSRNTDYMVLASTGLKSQTGEALNNDDSWFFTTGNEAVSGNIGDSVYDLDPSGLTASGISTDILVSGGVPLEVVETSPVSYTTDVDRRLGHVSIRFNGILSSGVTDVYDHIRVTSRRVLG